jgi:hypothetical protein
MLLNVFSPSPPPRLAESCCDRVKSLPLLLLLSRLLSFLDNLRRAILLEKDDVNLVSPTTFRVAWCGSCCGINRQKASHSRPLLITTMHVHTIQQDIESEKIRVAYDIPFGLSFWFGINLCTSSNRLKAVDVLSILLLILELVGYDNFTDQRLTRRVSCMVWRLDLAWFGSRMKRHNHVPVRFRVPGFLVTEKPCKKSKGFNFI